MSTDPENEFFADGVTEEILNALTQISELRVAGRTSSFSFKGKNQDLRQIGEALNVRTVLEGSVRRAGSRVRITAQLIDVTDGYHLWSERYDREIADVFAVQDEIAGAIAAKLKTTLAAGKEARGQRSTDNIDAYQAYLKGRALLYRRGNAIHQGLAEMRKALELDPTYALAWAGVADTYALLGYYGNIAPHEAREKSGEAAVQAMKYGPDLAEIHTANAMHALLFHWDWPAAERSFSRALELNPGYAQAAAWHQLFYRALVCGRWEDAVESLEEQSERDPRSAYLPGVIAITYAGFSKDRAMLKWVKRAQELDPDAFLTLWCNQLALSAIDDRPAAKAAGERALGATGRHVFVVYNLALLLAADGDREGATALYDELLSRGRREFVSPMPLAMLEAALGRPDDAVKHYREAIAMKDPQVIIFAAGWPYTDAMRAMPEYRAMVAEIGLPSARELNTRAAK